MLRSTRVLDTQKECPGRTFTAILPNWSIYYDCLGTIDALASFGRPNFGPPSTVGRSCRLVCVPSRQQSKISLFRTSRKRTCGVPVGNRCSGHPFLNHNMHVHYLQVVGVKRAAVCWPRPKFECELTKIKSDRGGLPPPFSLIEQLTLSMSVGRSMRLHHLGARVLGCRSLEGLVSLRYVNHTGAHGIQTGFAGREFSCRPAS